MDRTEILSTEGAASELTRRGLPVKKRTLEAWRIQGYGPRFRRLGAPRRGRVGYLLVDLEEWIQGAVRTSTADTGQSGRRGRATT